MGALFLRFTFTGRESPLVNFCGGIWLLCVPSWSRWEPDLQIRLENQTFESKFGMSDMKWSCKLQAKSTKLTKDPRFRMLLLAFNLHSFMSLNRTRWQGDIVVLTKRGNCWCILETLNIQIKQEKLRDLRLVVTNMIARVTKPLGITQNCSTRVNLCLNDWTWTYTN